MNRKQKLAAVLAVLLTYHAVPLCTHAAEPTLTGDTNVDGVVNVSDAVALNQYILEETLLTDAGICNADADHDGLITALDTSRMLSWIVGILTDEEFFGDTLLNQFDTSGFAYQWPEKFAQDDSVTITDTSYISHDVNIQITTHASDNMCYYVADIYVRDINSFRGAFAGGSYMEPRSGQCDSIKNMAAENNAILALNADYCEIRYNGVVYRNGVMYRDVERGDVAVLRKNGEMDVLTKSGFSALTETDRSEIWQTAHFGPGLVLDSVPLSGFSSNIAVANPRSGWGYYEPGHYCFVQCDGRQDGYSIGMTLDEFAALFGELGVKEAYNLDGGQSSEMVFNGETVNKPYNGGRYSSDILYICEIPE